ncbi:MAG: hypothetical protein HQ498_02175 [Pseudohongiella sp.]|jgi:predicted amidohydrolase|nr:hypothetical protein [Pseudohongiella sp.]
MIIEIRESIDLDAIYSASIDLEGLHYTPGMEDANAMAWQNAVEAGVLPEDSRVTDYIYTVVDAE